MKFSLTDIKIKGFYSFKNTSFVDLKDYNVLIGKNNAGKSNLFRVLNLLKDAFTMRPFNLESLFDGKKELETDITLVLELSEEFRKSLVEMLIEGNYLGHLLPKNQKSVKLQETLNFFIKKGFFYQIKISFSYGDRSSTLEPEKISARHREYDKEFIVFQSERKTSGDLTYRILEINHIKNKINVNNPFFQNLEHYFLHSLSMNNKPHKYGNQDLVNGFQNIISRFKNQSQNHHPLIAEILQEFKNTFFQKDLFHHIPDIRLFNKDKKFTDIEKTIPNEDGSNLGKFHARKKINEAEWLEIFNNKLKKFFPNLKEFSVKTEQNEALTYIKEKGLESQFKLETFGRGIINIAFFLTYLNYYVESENIILIEEPELFIFPGIQKKFRDKLIEISKIQNKQIFITTHSTHFLTRDRTISSIYQVKKENSESIVENISEAKLINIFRDLNLNLFDYALYEGVIFVEGLTDIDVFEIFIDDLYDKNFKILSIEGKHNLEHYASTKIMNFLSNIKFQYLFILDKDRGNENFYESISDENTKNKVKSRILTIPLYELENLFIQPILLFDFLWTKLGIENLEKNFDWIKNRILDLFRNNEKYKREFLLKKINDEINPRLKRKEIKEILEGSKDIEDFEKLFKLWYDEFNHTLSKRLDYIDKIRLNQEKFYARLKKIKEKYEEDYQNERYNEIIPGKVVFKELRTEIVNKFHLPQFSFRELAKHIVFLIKEFITFQSDENFNSRVKSRPKFVSDVDIRNFKRYLTKIIENFKFIKEEMNCSFQRNIKLENIEINEIETFLMDRWYN